MPNVLRTSKAGYNGGMKLTFCGGAKIVTGSNYLLESGDTKILVDCGLNQGESFCEDLNYEQFPYNPREVQAVFVTHAHIDHIGRLPKLVKDGFRGAIYSTEPTKDFALPMLEDTAHLFGEEAVKRGHQPLYDGDDIDRTLGLWQGFAYHKTVAVGPFSVEFFNAGHILGSSSLVVSVEGKKIVFSGDLGNNPSPLITGTEYPTDVDYALVESAYGDRVHEDLDKRKEILREDVQGAVRRGGVLMIPAFALERTQEMLFELNDMVEKKEIPAVPVFVDSPLAIKLTDVYRKYSQNPLYFNEGFIDVVRSGENIFDFPGLTTTLTKEESKKINDVQPPKIVIAGAGMSNGGRILHHEVRYLSDPRSTLLIVGYQSVNSLGRRLLDGERRVEILGQVVEVRATILSISGYSAHADQSQLLDWVFRLGKGVKKVFVVQGDGNASDVLAEKIKEKFSLDVLAPSRGDSVLL